MILIPRLGCMCIVRNIVNTSEPGGDFKTLTGSYVHCAHCAVMFVQKIESSKSFL